MANISVTTASENLIKAMNEHIIPNQEYLLQGSILDSAVEHLLHRRVSPLRMLLIKFIAKFNSKFLIILNFSSTFRLKGLCDNVDSGPEQFQDHEISFSLRMPNQAVSYPTHDFIIPSI